MPFLSRKSPHPKPGPQSEQKAGPRLAFNTSDQSEILSSEAVQKGLLLTCANPGCRSGWLHLGRSRSRPVFENGWTCSPECTAGRLAVAVARELDGRGGIESHRHRVPLGLLMLEQGWISAGQLKKARESQREGGGRLGEWLVSRGGVSESLLTRALSLQWSCPVLPMGSFDPEALSPVLPRLFAEAFGALPLRIAAGKLVYLGYEQRPDPVLALALERMSGLRVESGLVEGSQFVAAHARFLETIFPNAEFLEAVSEPAVVRALARTIERARPAQSRLVRVHDWLWLRLWRKRPTSPVAERNNIQDVICTLSAQ
jgi:hypothetical protein